MTLRADEDAPQWSILRRRVFEDLAFLRRVRGLREAGDLEGLVLLAAETCSAVIEAAERGRSGPRWRRVAVERALGAVLRAREGKDTG